MKTKFLSIAATVALLFAASACHSPYEFSPTQFEDTDDLHSNKHFDSVSANFDDDTETTFVGEFDNDNRIITIVVPYTYPLNTESYLEMEDLTKVKVTFNLKQGHVIEPAMPSFIDLTREYNFTVIDNYGVRTPYTLKGEIRKSAECEILDFSIPALGVPGIIRPDNFLITLVSPEIIGEQLAEVEVSHGATLDPDPRVTPLNFDEDRTITVTAQNGVDKRVYNLTKSIPSKLSNGLRSGSARILWTKKQADMGVSIYTNAQIDGGDLRFNGSAGLGIAGDNLVMNEAGMGKAYVMNYKNGNVITTIDLTGMGTNSLGQYNNHRMTSDDNGNLLFTSAANFNGGTLTIWKMKGTGGHLEKLATLANGTAIGSAISVTGNLDGNAIITANNNGAMQFYRWVVTNGVIGECEIVKPEGYTGNCWGNYDAVYLNSTLPSDYIGVGYVGFSILPPNADGAVNRTCAWFDGSSNTIKSYGKNVITSNSVENAADMVEFNNVKYYAHNVLNTLGYGYGASIFMYNLSTGDLSTPEIDFSENGINLRNNYGASAASSTKDRGGNGGDVRFFASPDGYFLYIFFEFCNGYVGAVRADCIDM